jgi:hypothetical protein
VSGLAFTVGVALVPGFVHVFPDSRLAYEDNWP